MSMPQSVDILFLVHTKKLRHNKTQLLIALYIIYSLAVFPNPANLILNQPKTKPKKFAPVIHSTA